MDADHGQAMPILWDGYRSDDRCIVLGHVSAREADAARASEAADRDVELPERGPWRKRWGSWSEWGEDDSGAVACGPDSQRFTIHRRRANGRFPITTCVACWIEEEWRQRKALRRAAALAAPFAEVVTILLGSGGEVFLRLPGGRACASWRPRTGVRVSPGYENAWRSARDAYEAQHANRDLIPWKDIVASLEELVRADQRFREASREVDGLLYQLKRAGGAPRPGDMPAGPAPSDDEVAAARFRASHEAATVIEKVRRLSLPGLDRIRKAAGILGLVERMGLQKERPAAGVELIVEWARAVVQADDDRRRLMASISTGDCSPSEARIALDTLWRRIEQLRNALA